MRRRLFTFCSALSLLACVSTGAIWVRSHWLTDQVRYLWTNGNAWAWTPKDSLETGIYLGDCSGEPPELHGFTHGRGPIESPFISLVFVSTEPNDKILNWSRGGFKWYSIAERATGNFHAEAVAPFWAIATVTMLLPLIWITLRLRSRALGDRKKLGFCPSCGYDLRATPGRCPECGRQTQSVA